jgi:hypothetical protein
MDTLNKISSNNKEKLVKLSEIEGVPELTLLENAVMDTSCKGICMTPGCSYTTDVEPDQTEGYCEVCDTNTVSSCLVLVGIV